MIRGTDTVLSGANVRLRHPNWADFDDWVRARFQSRAELARWEPDWDDNIADRRLYKHRLNIYRRFAGAGTAYPFHVFDASGQLVGGCNLADIKRQVARSAQIGYWIATPHTRRGYGLEAVRLVTDFAFAGLGLHRLEAAVQDTNHASTGLLTKAGYRSEGLARGYLRIGEDWVDHRIWAKLSSD